MADIGGAVKDNKQLLLALAGLIVMLLVVSAVAGGQGVFNFSDRVFENIEDVTDGASTGDTTPDAVPELVDNGNNNKYSSPPAPILKSGVNYYARVETNKGSFEIDLYEKNSPINVNNFVFLSNEGFYDGTSFHRVIEDFIIQGGDPLGNGTGGPGYKIVDEIQRNINFRPYIVAMANSGANTNGSQFFITTKRFKATNLVGDYTIIGEISSGFNIVDRIEQVDVGTLGAVEDIPLEPVVIESIKVVER